jgi:pyridoxamine 5'-phosphate oxidase family protein
MSVFSEAELRYLGSQRPGRLATVGEDGYPCVVPVAFCYNPEVGAIDIGGHRFTERETFRDVQRTGVAALLVDDALPPQRPRAVEVCGEAVAAAEVGGLLRRPTTMDRLADRSPGMVITTVSKWCDS